ncbi:DUF4340 domain-containing protein [Stenomitos frigidus]|uniref:DUF4340 domain-containing protein n=1 Tax=Stenomitos frigidus ULC18 TaxID=2107698 RepID=A0A2T1DZV2_9CYAN|nr:DUF4340 domain-containing protein [Stenomitos frigidus]PSB26020.1 hypothetical protein C7B82_21210 [Stenomitos frigidus ULC18]
MKFQKTPLILLAIALLLGAFVYLYEVQGKPQRETAKAQTEQLFAFKEEEVRSLTLTTPTQTLAFAKTPAARLPGAKPDQPAKPQPASPKATPTETLTWAMTAPEQTVANDASVAYLLNLLVTGKRQQTLTVSAAKQAEFGLDKPIAIADVKLASQQTHRLVLGKPNFNRSALYAQVDPPAQTKTDLTVLLVSTDFENAVNRPLADWKVKEPAAQSSPTPKVTQPGSKKP